MRVTEGTQQEEAMEHISLGTRAMGQMSSTSRTLVRLRAQLDLVWYRVQARHVRGGRWLSNPQGLLVPPGIRQTQTDL